VTRLLLISTEFPPGPGGIGTNAYQIALQLSRLGWEVAVLCAQDYMPDAEIKMFNAQQPFRVKPLVSAKHRSNIWIARWRTTNYWLNHWRPDIVLATGTRAVWLAAALATFRRLPPWVAIGHGSEFAQPAAWRRAITRYAFERASAVICVSHFTSRQMTAAGIKPKYSEVIHNGADHTRFAPMTAEEILPVCESLGLTFGGRFVPTIGNVTERKGQDTVIRAMPSILSYFPDVHYLIAGLPTNLHKYAALAAELGVGDHVHFLGFVPDSQVPALLSMSKVFVMTSRYTPGGKFEGYGISVVEAALCGIPAVVSDDSGLVEAIVPGVTGIAVPPNDPAATADAIESLLADEARRRQMGEAARRHALAEQTWERRGRSYNQFLSRLIKN
jgi:phosphatidyl-myo-inositol dimannoside synthase